MIVLTFHSHLEAAIMQGIKTHTIRATRMRALTGEHLSLRVWSGRPYWSKQKLLLEARCTNVQTIKIDITESRRYVSVDGLFLPWRDVDKLAMKDGFDDGQAMFEYFKKRIPFTGWLISWG